jgi:hypothetical protein
MTGAISLFGFFKPLVGYAFTISGYLPVDEFVKIAESITLE